jgi:phosphohistidine phosphatase
MIVYFLRHASAGEPYSNPKKDEKRGLDKEGIQQCGFIGRALAGLDVHVDAVLSSPLKRCTQTAVAVGNEIGYDGKLSLEASLHPKGKFEDFRKALRKHSNSEAIMVVGHNPNLSVYLGFLIGNNSEAVGIDLKKGAVAKVIVEKKYAALEWCMTPKVVRAIYDAAGAGKKNPKK